MNPLQRLFRYASAWAQLPGLRRTSLDSCSLEELVDAVFSYAGGFLAPVQVKEEILGALRLIEAAKPRYIIEIGTSMGGTLYLWTRIAHPEAIIVTLDLHGGEFGGGYSSLRAPIYRRLARPRQTLHLVLGDSHQPETVALTRRLLNNHEADFLFIDADHTEAGVRADYSLYSGLVRKGGIVMFHDIAITRPEYGVRKFWQEISPAHEAHEFIGHPVAYGLGLLYR
jgi:cephalosporin hydroxylase